MNSRNIYIQKYKGLNTSDSALRCRTEGGRATCIFCQHLSWGWANHPAPLLPEYSQLHQAFSKLPIAWLCFSPHSGQPWSKSQSVAEPKGNLPVVPWFMASRGKGHVWALLLSAAPLACRGFGTSTILTLGEGLSPVTFRSLCGGGWSPLIPASARAELLHQSKGMKLSPAV